ncbi:hypothetical protein [Streptomyces sp. NPDC088725]|uniref:hypothetical protein n=1 Tax=Streptomyces sp. NPDC088725 TaxID=3365873 RepID=UPI003806B71F
MTTAIFPPPHGATGTAPHHPAHRVGNALRVIKVFVTAAFSVAVLGEYTEEASDKRG